MCIVRRWGPRETVRPANECVPAGPRVGSSTDHARAAADVQQDAPGFPVTGRSGRATARRVRGARQQRLLPLWSGQAAALTREEGAEALTRRLWADGQAVTLGLSERWKA